MCDCKKECDCKTKQSLFAPFEIKEVRDAMKANAVNIAKIYVKHGFGNLPVNQFTAGLAYKQKPAIAADLAPYIIPAGYNNAAGDVGDTAITDTDEAGDKQQTRVDWATQILDWTGSAVDIATDIAGTVAVKRALEDATPGTTVSTTGVSDQPKTAKETAEQKKILGLSYMQAALAAAVVLVLIVLVYFGTRPKKAA